MPDGLPSLLLCRVSGNPSADALGPPMPCTRRTLAAALTLALLACGGKHGAESPDAGSSTYALTLVGGANLVLHPSEKRTLQVLLAKDQVGPVASASVHFEFQDGDPAGAKIDLADVQTDGSGVATVHFTAGTSSSGRPTYKLVASAPSFGPDPVAFSFNVIPVRRLLQIVGSPSTHVAADGQSAAVTIAANTSVGLKVRELDADTGNSIAQDSLTFSLPPAASNIYWTGNTATATTQTGAGGDAQVFLFTKGTAGGPWLITGQSAGGGAAVTFSVTVQLPTGSGCTNNSQCPAGQVCAGNPGTCQAGGTSSGCDNGTDNPCPYGYLCIAGVCQPPTQNCDPNAPNCANGLCCDPASLACKSVCPTTCAAGTHCQPGASCGTGSCVSDAVIPDVTGTWLTRHDYSIVKALPTALRDVFMAIRLLDQALLGKLTIQGLPSWLQAIINSFISKLLQNYLPDWLQTVIHIADDIVTVLSNLRSEGSMHLVVNPDVAHVKGTEVWTSLVFYWLPLCNGNIGGDPGVPPDCARIDIATTDSQNPGEVGQCKGQSLPTITVQVRPFSATVAPTAVGAKTYAINVDKRQVNVQMGKVLLVLVDLIISYVTPYHCIDEITDCHAGPGGCPLLDCYGLSQDLAGPGTWLGGFIDPSTLEGLCDGVVTTAGQAVTQLLATVWSPTADILDFSGHASVSGAATDPSVCLAGSSSCAAQLGNANWDKDLNSSSSATVNGRDGNWSGDFFFKVIGKLPGAWQATRPQ